LLFDVHTEILAVTGTTIVGIIQSEVRYNIVIENLAIKARNTVVNLTPYSQFIFALL